MPNARKKKSGPTKGGPNLTTPQTDNLKNNIHVGLLPKMSQNRRRGKWHSPGDVSKRRQPTIYNTGSLVFNKEENIKDEEALMTASGTCPNGVPKGLDDRCYRYKVISYDGSKKTFNLKYLDQCVRSDGHE